MDSALEIVQFQILGQAQANELLNGRECAKQGFLLQGA